MIHITPVSRYTLLVSCENLQHQVSPENSILKPLMHSDNTYERVKSSDKSYNKESLVQHILRVLGMKSFLLVTPANISSGHEPCGSNMI